MSKKTRHEEHEEHADESWLLPYSDLMTLLVALFLVMYAMSATDAKKFEDMADAFSSALSGGGGVLEYRSDAPTNTQLDQGKQDKMNSVIDKNTGESDMAKLRAKEQEDLEKLKSSLINILKRTG